jgi:hypothetical protein
MRLSKRKGDKYGTLSQVGRETGSEEQLIQKGSDIRFMSSRLSREAMRMYRRELM